jgi:TRAP-type C4-dicarboxylate transport system substrate-binding protein
VAAAAVAVTLAVAATACGGSAADKAGGRGEPPAKPVGERVTLTLATVDELWASEFAAAAKRLSGGTIRIDVRLGGKAIVDYEPRLVEMVRTGRADMASVGARVWDRMGVASFQALVAPFLVDSLELQQRVLESHATDALLDDVRPLGLVGLALLPGPLRRPLGLSRLLVGPRDYAGARVGIRFGRVAEDTLEALGAMPAGYRIGSLAGLDGAELDLATLVRNRYDAPGSNVTANVVFWARPETIVIGRRAFDRLDPAQRDVLRRAGRAAAAPVLARLHSEQNDALSALCSGGTMSFVTASESQVAALRAAVRPVYGRLERDPTTRALIAEIRSLRAQSPGGEPLRCRRRGAGASALEGRWESTLSPGAMRANGASEAEVATYAGHGTLELGHGRWTFRNDRTVVTGTYSVAGDGIRMTMVACTANPCSPGAATDYTWTVYRDTLELVRIPGRPSNPAAVAKPFTRVR